MKQTIRLTLALLAILTFAHCKSNDDTRKKIDETNRTIDQIPIDTKKTSDDAIKSVDETMKKITESTLDLTAQGGQPGFVFLFGDLINDQGLDPRITLQLSPGTSWKGTKPKLDPRLVSGTIVAKSIVEEIEKLQSDKTYINLGCDTTGRAELSGLQEAKIDSQTSPIVLIKAKVVLLCDENKLSAEKNLITAETVIISGLKYEMVGTAEKEFSIKTKHLILENVSSIAAKAPDASTTILMGPSLTIMAAQLSGNGKLEISSEGSSYKKE